MKTMDPLESSKSAMDIDTVSGHFETTSNNCDAANENAKSGGVPSTGRGRSYSVSTVQPSVETVVSKAKRAASTLWILLHAQSCVLGRKCPYPGCLEGKRLHLHLKTCSASTGEDACPTGWNGCEQARKLLAHYRRCRSIRARQAGQLGGRREIASHHCLVCSLVARQARTMLDRPSSTLSSSTSSSSTTTKSAVPHKNVTTTSRQIKSSFMLKSSNSHNMTLCDVAFPPSAAAGNMMLPPPPRRTLLTPQREPHDPSHEAMDFDDAYSSDKKSSKTISFAYVNQVVANSLRPRSVSHDGGVCSPSVNLLLSGTEERGDSFASSLPEEVRRSRSLSLGASPPALYCETIEEEEESTREFEDPADLNP